MWFYLRRLLRARDFFRKAAPKRPAERSDAPLPTVTDSQAAQGLDVDLYDNLATFCRQDYPTFQIVFGVADADDPAVAGGAPAAGTASRSVPIDLVIDGRIYGTNYKVSNLHNMYRVAKHDVIVIADSDIRVRSDYLRRIVAPLEDPRGRHGHLPLPRRQHGRACRRWSRACSSTPISRPWCWWRAWSRSRRYAFGATIALRRSVLDEIGGFLPLANYLADDYYLGNRVAERGYGLALSDVVVETVLAVGGWRRLFDHQLRWARTYRNCRPGGYFGSILTHGTLWATLNLLYNHFSPLACVVAALVYGTRMTVASTIANRYLHAPAALAARHCWCR